MEYRITSNPKWAKDKRTKTFENQGEGYSSYVAINSDSSFEFLVVGEGPDHLAVGKWKRLSNSIISLTWNPAQSQQACKDNEESLKYYQHSTFTPIDITSWQFIQTKRKLIPMKRR